MNLLLPFLLLVAAPAPAPVVAPAPVAAPAPVVAPAPAPAPDDSVPRPLRLGFTSTSAFGVTHAKFFNQLVGARLDYRFTSRFAFGGTLAYANLKGKDRRVHEVLPEVLTEYRVPLQKESFGLPIRLALGYLPKNGPTLRIGAGLDFALSDRVSLELVPLEPMVWLNRERPEVSLNASLALRVAF
jgi:hypothetical protein